MSPRYSTANTALDHRPAGDTIAAACRRLGVKPLMAITLGSGLGPLSDALRDPLMVPYGQLTNFPQPTVSGHAGRLVIGWLDDVPVLTMQGRMHVYEGHAPAQLAVPLRAFAHAGIDILTQTNASGSTRMDMGPGSLIAVSDHINFGGPNPLIGPNDDGVGPRFFDMTQAYDPALRRHLVAALGDCGLPAHQGVYMWFVGPNFETPAEIRMAQMMGVDCLGMSTVPETLAARHCGIRVACLSSVTNYAAGLTDTQLSHEETLAVATKNAANLTHVIRAFAARVAAATATAEANTVT